ncbi:MAG: 30S ribosomal protein S8 [Desulfobacterota bacterium]|nr:30S ribosomal protein S8 [Thermodesulfobacteriota bacterium]
MMMTDPIADMLTRIRNANKARFASVEVPASTMKVNIAKILKQEGYIKNYKVIQDNKQGMLQIFLKYGKKGEPVISEIRRVSKPSRRIYVDKNTIPAVRNGLGLAILTTSRGMMTDKEARQQGIGGEVICTFW